MDKITFDVRHKQWLDIIHACNASGLTRKAWYEQNFVSPNNTILTRANVDDQGNVKGGVKRGDIFIDDDGTTYIMKASSDWQNAPNGNTENSNWIKLQLN